MIYDWHKQGRRPATFCAVAALWGLAAVLWFWFQASWVLVALILLTAVPVCVDLARNPQSRLEVWRGRLVWISALKNGDTSDIEKVRLDRRFDGGMRLTVLHANGSHTRLPPDVAPPVAQLELALKDAGIPAERHPFSPF